MFGSSSSRLLSRQVQRRCPFRASRLRRVRVRTASFPHLSFSSRTARRRTRTETASSVARRDRTESSMLAPMPTLSTTSSSDDTTRGIGEARGTTDLTLGQPASSRDAALSETCTTPVQRSEASCVVMLQEGAVGLEHQEAYGFGEPGGETTRVKDLAAGDEQAHSAGPYCPFRTEPREVTCAPPLTRR